jgi:predicted DNA-binding transcriptional regulator YafY
VCGVLSFGFGFGFGVNRGTENAFEIKTREDMATQSEHEHGHKLRLLLVLRALVDSPNRYTKKDLATKFGVHKDTITNYFKDFESAGFAIEKDGKYRYCFQTDATYSALQQLLHFSEEDQAYLIEALQKLDRHSRKSEQLQLKISALYDFTQLGFENLRKPYLAKINLLEQARKEEKQVRLLGYRSSNSSKISDRTVEPFQCKPEEDILHAYDLRRNRILHFRLSRIQHIQPLDQAWEHKTKHQIHPTDPFRIADSQQVQVHLKLSVGAYNELLERFPMTRAYLRPAAEPDYFDFEARVNHRFFGLANFILGNYHLKVAVLGPESLKQHLRKMVEEMKF